jgi:3-oxoacyl-[acyl-carrier-protein] synthase II
VSDRRVVVTGVGAVTPVGTGVEGLWQGLLARRSAVRTITRFDSTPFRSHIAAEIPDFRPQDHLDARSARRLDRFSQLAVTSARLALADAGLDLAREDPDRVGAMMGSALGRRGVRGSAGGVPHGGRTRLIRRSRSPCSPARRAATSRSRWA